MNAEEEVPTRVTRGALRRRSIDQDAAAPNPPTTGTTVTGGTPKKANNTGKKGSALGAIQEDQARPSTPISASGGRISSKRRISETIDTPTTAPNKLVQSLKESETVVGSGSGRRSRNTSPTLTEENVRNLDATNEGTGTTGRIRTPARLRASYETLSSATPQPTARRSTRRNSITSDDGSVQSLPITGPKTPVIRSLKDETILEEDNSSGGGDHQVEAQSSPLNVRRQSGVPQTVSPSPLLNTKREMTPTRGSVSPKSISSARKTPKSTPTSKNVSFADDSKQEDHQSGYPKTPTSPGKKFVLVEVNDLRNTPLINGTPKANAVIELGGSDEKTQRSAKEDTKANKNDSSFVDIDAEKKTAANETPQEARAEEKKKQHATLVVASDTPTKDNIPAGADRSMAPSSNDVSGIEVLETSLIGEDVVNVSTASQKANGEKYSKCWSQSVRGTTTTGIDAFRVRKQEEEEKLNTSSEQEKETEMQKEKEKEEEEEEEEDEGEKRSEFIDDEAMEVDGYQSGDSLDSETRKEMQENELSDHGEDLGTEDTEEEDDEVQDDENDSFIVSDDDEQADEESLLTGSGDDLGMSGAAASPAKKTSKQNTPSWRRIIQKEDDTDEEPEAKKGAVSSSPSPAKGKRSAKRLTMTDEEASPEKKFNLSVTPEKGTGKRQSPKKLNDEKANGTADTIDTTDTSPNKTGQSSATETTPSKAAAPEDVSIQSDTKSPVADKSYESDQIVASETSQKDISIDSATNDEGEKEEEVEEDSKDQAKFANRSDLSGVSTAASRKSLPVGVESAKGNKEAVVARKSLPAGLKMQFVEEVSTEGELQPSTSNLDGSFEEQQVPKNQEKISGSEGENQTGAEKVVTVGGTSDEEEFYEAAESIAQEVSAVDGLKNAEEKEKSAKEAENSERSVAKPDRKSMPLMSLVSAQFYLGGTKKDKRNTIGGGGEAAGMERATSTPNQKPTAGNKGQKTASTPSSTKLVANPFALKASAKGKKRLSMDSAAADKKQDPAAEQNNKSLPAIKLAAHPSSTAVVQIAGTEHHPQLDEPEPMEVDEYIEADDGGAATEAKAGSDELGEEEKQSAEEDLTAAVEVKPKTPANKSKRLEDYDLESIMKRCNEVMRAEKERKKQTASLTNQRRKEKKRLRQLREEQEKVNGHGTKSGDVQDEDAGTDGDATEKPVNQTTSSANEGDEGHPRSDDPAKKKKKRKKKVKNYVLEEMAELKKDYVSDALLRKMEALEARKQRKKQRLAEKMKLLNKENGDGLVSANGGIGAKLKKVSKKKQKQQLAAVEEAASAGAESKQPVVRMAVSAFSVFQQLQNGHGQPIVTSPSLKNDASIVSLDDGKKSKKVAKGKTADPQEHPNELEKGSKKRNEMKEKPNRKPQQQHVQVTKEEQRQNAPTKRTEKSQPQAEVSEKKVVAPTKTPTADDVIQPKKKAADGSKVPVAKNGVPRKAASESLVEPTAVLSLEKFKRKQKKQNMDAGDGAGLSETAEPAREEEPVSVKKQKKPKADKRVVAAVEENFTESSLPKGKKAIKKSVVSEAEGQKKKIGPGWEKTKKKESVVASALQEIRTVYQMESELAKKKAKKITLKKRENTEPAAAVVANGKSPEAIIAVPDLSTIGGPPKKRKREVFDVSPATNGTPRPTKLRALQRADHGFVEETITPEKMRLKRNFGFEENQATPKAVGFKVSSLLPSDDLRQLAVDTTKSDKKRKKLAKGSVPEPDRTLPLPIWTSSGYFLEIPDEKKPSDASKGEGRKKATNGGTTATNNSSSYIPVKGGHAGFKLKKLRNESEGSGKTSSSSAKPHRIDPDTIAPSVVNFKRQQLLEMTAHLREKKKSGGLL